MIPGIVADAPQKYFPISLYTPGEIIGTGAISYGNGGTYNFSNLRDKNNVNNMPAEGDIVLAVTGRNAYSETPPASVVRPTGYTFLCQYTGNFQISYKVMGASPDTSLVYPYFATGGDYSYIAAAVVAIRGLDPAQLLDAAVVYTSQAGSGTGVNPGPITPATKGAIILCGAYTTDAYVTDPWTRPANMDADLNHFRQAHKAWTGSIAEQDTALALLTTDLDGATFDPDPFGGVASSGDTRYCMTLALRVKDAPLADSTVVTVTGTLVNGGVLTNNITGATYAWYENGSLIPGATAQSYNLPSNAEGKYYKSSATVGGVTKMSAEVGPVPPDPTSTQWRVYVTAQVNSSSWTSIYELEMHETAGGADQCSGGTASADGYGGSDVPARAFDNSTSTRWSRGSTAVPCWIQYTFSSPKTIREVAMYVQAVNDSPKNFQIQYWNGSAWVTYWSVSNYTSWSANQWRTFTK